METRDTPAPIGTQLKTRSIQAHILTVIKTNTGLPHLSLSQHGEKTVLFSGKEFSAEPFTY